MENPNEIKWFVIRENINIVDNMLDKLEKYAKNLEVVVQQRTEKLMEEKKKTDILLHMMLPQCVCLTANVFVLLSLM